MKHTIDTGNKPPTYAKMQQLSQEKYNSAKEEFISLLNARVIWHQNLHRHLLYTQCQRAPQVNGEFVVITDGNLLRFYLDVAQGHMKGAPNETQTHSCRFASRAC